MTRRWRGLALVLAGAAACGYYNGMWSADHFAGEARRQEREGRTEEARTTWAMAATRAESVVARHPQGRWSDRALVLEGEALAKSAACDRAAAPLARALQSVQDVALRDRAGLAAAECALAASDPASAERLLDPLTGSADRERAAQARFLAGRAAELRGDLDAAARWYGGSSQRGARGARAHVLLVAGRTDAGLALLDSLVHARFEEADWTALLGDVGRAAGPGAASAALDRLLAQGHAPVGAQARLLVADGDRLFAAGALAAAGARYTQAAAAVPDSMAGQEGRVAELWVLAALAESLPQLRSVAGRLGTLLESGAGGGGGGAAVSKGRELQRRIRLVLAADEEGDVALFHAAEVVRDSLAAPHLAARLFLAFARRHPASLFAPKALIAVIGLAPERADSVVGVLQSAYATSPYTLALGGETSPAYAAAEDSLAQAEGVDLERAGPPPPGVSLVAPSVTGPRGPPLDGPEPRRVEQPRTPGRKEPEGHRPPRPVERP